VVCRCSDRPCLSCVALSPCPHYQPASFTLVQLTLQYLTPSFCTCNALHESACRLCNRAAAYVPAASYQPASFTLVQSTLQYLTPSFSTCKTSACRLCNRAAAYVPAARYQPAPVSDDGAYLKPLFLTAYNVVDSSYAAWYRDMVQVRGIKKFTDMILCVWFAVAHWLCGVLGPCLFG
jgi:hypothetical protein